MSSLTYYKIRSKSNPDLFRKSDGTWNKSGKVYDTLAKLRSMLTHEMKVSRYRRERLDDFEVVEYEVSIKAIKPVHEVISPARIIDYLKA